MALLRSALAVIAGLILISLIVEPLEFALVTLVNGGVTMNPTEYFGIRNRSAFLAGKLLYNTLAAIAGGYVTARIARRRPIVHGFLLAAIQTAAFGWALANPNMRQSTPDWMWAALIVLTAAGIIGGALLRSLKTRI